MSKNTKQSQMKQITSLDEKHSEMLEKFHHNKEYEIPKLKNEIKELKSMLQSYNKTQIDKILTFKMK